MHRGFSSYCLPLMIIAIIFCMSCHRTHKIQGTDNEITNSLYDSMRNSAEPAKDTILTEYFEGVSKTSYQKASLTCQSGLWILDDAVIANGNPYARPDDHAVRIRNIGKLSMNFDVDLTAKTFVQITNSINKNDGPSDWAIFASNDKGKTYHQLYVTMHANTFAAKIFYLDPKVHGPTRFEIRKLSGGKNQINIDDIVIYKLSDKKR